MAAAPGGSRRRGPSRRLSNSRYTIDAGVFVNAFNPHEAGHDASLRLLAAIHERGDPVMLPALVIPEIAAAVARASGDSVGALQYADATAALPHVILVTLTTALARRAAELATAYRLRGADAIYLAVAHRYGTMLVSRDEEQRTRGSAIVTCRSPEQALRAGR